MSEALREEADVVVAGAGVIGLSIAFELARAGRHVLVLERAHAGSGATSAAGGMLAPVSEADLEEGPLLSLGLDSLRRYGRFVADVEEVSALRCGLRTDGTLWVAVHRDDQEELAHLRATLRERGLAVLGAEPGHAVQAFRLDLQGLASWQAYAGLRRHLLESAGALEVVPERFQAGRAVVRVRAPGGPDALAARLAAAPPSGLVVEAIGVSGDVLALRIAEEPPLLAPPGAESLAPFDTPD